MATHSSILAWRIPWTEGPGGLQSMGSQTVGRDRGTEVQKFTFPQHKQTDNMSHTENVDLGKKKA